MTTNQTDQYLAGARTVGDMLIERAKRDEGGLYWESLGMGPDQEPVYGVGDGLYSGVSGIALFMVELFRQTGEARYGDTAREALAWLDRYCAENEALSLAYFTGRLGVFEPFLRMGRVTGEDHWRERALAVAEPIREFRDDQFRIDDLLNGRAGSMVGLAKLHAATGADWLLEPLDRLVGQVVRGAHLGPKGLYWDRSEQNITGLCGFSHGSAGVGYAFFEVGAYLDNPALIQLGDEAFAYESQCFNEQIGAWPDWRKGVFKDEDREEHLQALRDGDLEFFHKPKHMDAWCHGSHGIGLARLRAFELTGRWREDLDRALKRAEYVLGLSLEHLRDRSDFTLCHGFCGSLDLFYEANRHLGRPLPDYTQTIIDRVLENLRTGAKFSSGYGLFKDRPEDVSLFMGIAGIGYFLLRLCDPEGAESLLLPRIDKAKAGTVAGDWLNVDLAGVRKTLLAKVYDRTVEALEAIAPAAAQVFFKTSSDADLRDAFAAFVEQTAKDLAPEQRDRLLDALHFERARLDLQRSLTSDAMVHAKRLDHYRKLESRAAAAEDPSQRLVLPEEARIVETRWNWIDDDAVARNLQSEPEAVAILLRATPTEVQAFDLGAFAQVALGAFQEPAAIEEGVARVSEAFELEDDAQRRQVRDMTLSQIDEALASHMLEFAD